MYLLLYMRVLLLISGSGATGLAERGELGGAATGMFAGGKGSGEKNHNMKKVGEAAMEFARLKFESHVHKQETEEMGKPMAAHHSPTHL